MLNLVQRNMSNKIKRIDKRYQKQRKNYFFRVDATYLAKDKIFGPRRNFLAKDQIFGPGQIFFFLSSDE